MDDFDDSHAYNDDDEYGASSSAAASGGADASNARSVSLHRIAALPRVEMHSIPCNIAQDVRGTKIDAYFQVSAGEGADASATGAETAQFRGREMLGKKIALTTNLVGLVFESNAHNGALHPVSTFDALHVWHRAPTERESLPRVLRAWLPLAHAIHDPVSVEPVSVVE